MRTDWLLAFYERRALHLLWRDADEQGGARRGEAGRGGSDRGAELSVLHSETKYKQYVCSKEKSQRFQVPRF